MDALDAAATISILQEPDTDEKYTIITGMMYGSSFVGMVHLLNSTDTTASDAVTSAAATIHGQMEIGCLFVNYAGGFGVDSSIGTEVKNLPSTPNTTAHVTLISMGVIPSVVANDVQLAVQTFRHFDPKSAMESIAVLNNATASDHNNAQKSTQTARTRQQMIASKTSDMKSALDSLKDIQDGKNKVIDNNSMMTALDDYLKKAASGDCGTPVNYYLQDIYKKQLAEMGASEYYPGKYLTIKFDDSAGPVGQPPQSGGEASTAA